MKKMMTPAQVAAKIGHVIKKNEDILNFSPVGPRANTARINLNRAQAALASLQETNEGMRIGKQPQAQMGAPIPNDMNYMQARYGGYTPKFGDGGNTEGSPMNIAQFEESMKTILEAEFTENSFSAENELSDLMEYAKNHPDELDSIVAEALKGNIPTVNVGHSGAEPELLFERPYYERFPDEAPADWENPFPPAVEESNIEELDEEPVVESKSEALPETASNELFYPSPSVYDPFAQDKQVLPQQGQLGIEAMNTNIPPEEQQSSLPLLTADDAIPPEAATMTASGRGRGYLGNTFIDESTNPDVPVPITPEQAEAQANTQKLLEEFNALSPNEQSTARVKAYMDVTSPDFTHEEVMEWGGDNYGVSEGRGNSSNEFGIDNTIIGANVYHKDKGHVLYNTMPDAGIGISVDETRILLQGLVNNGLSKEQAFEALSDPVTYRSIKENMGKTSFGNRSIEKMQEAVGKVDEWARTTSNREQLASVTDRGEEDGDDWFATELAPGVNPEVSAYDVRLAKDREVFLSNNPGSLYLPGRGGTMWDLNRNHQGERGQFGEEQWDMTLERERSADPNSYNVMPSFIGDEIGQTGVLDDDVIPEIVEDKKEDKKKDKEKGTEEKKVWNPDTKKWETKGPDTYNLDMGNPSALMAIPGLAALASARMQGRALDNMQGPPKPITTMMPQFNYKSNIGQQLQEVKDASNAVMQNTNLQGQQAAALNQQVMAQRLKSNSGLLQQDAQQEQAARAQYDAMATQVRMTNDTLRNAYLQDSTNFKNKKEMLQTSARQQPLNVLASSAQDYLQNVYKSNLAAQMEAVGRPYETGFDAEGNPLT